MSQHVINENYFFARCFLGSVSWYFRVWVYILFCFVFRFVFFVFGARRLQLKHYEIESRHLILPEIKSMAFQERLSRAVGRSVNQSSESKLLKRKKKVLAFALIFKHWIIKIQCTPSNVTLKINIYRKARTNCRSHFARAIQPTNKIHIHTETMANYKILMSNWAELKKKTKMVLYYYYFFVTCSRLSWWQLVASVEGKRKLQTQTI